MFLILSIIIKFKKINKLKINKLKINKLIN